MNDKCYKHTLRMCILSAFPLQQWLYEHAVMLRYTYTDCHVITVTVNVCELQKFFWFLFLPFFLPAFFLSLIYSLFISNVTAMAVSTFVYHSGGAGFVSRFRDGVSWRGLLNFVQFVQEKSVTHRKMKQPQSLSSTLYSPIIRHYILLLERYFK